MAERRTPPALLRPVRETDAGHLLELWNAAARFDPLTPSLLSEKLWADPDFDPAMALLAEVDGGAAGFAFGLLRAASRAPLGYVKLLAVDPAARRRGLGSQLLETIETTLRSRGAHSVRICESAPNYLTPGVDARYSAAPHFLEARGYARVAEACNMTVDLGQRDFDTVEAERRLAARGVAIRRACADDHARISELLRDEWPSWLPEVRRALRNEPASVYIAVQGGAVVAFSAYDANNRGTGWFGPMGTAPGARRQGIGHVLLFRCLADMAAQGHGHATIPWVDPVDFYRHCAGAAVSRIFHRYEKVLAR